jgi:DNA-directed RNA polymerase subunit RPC12/RpoP
MKCEKDFILIKEDVDDTVRKNKYISCPHCGSKRITPEESKDSFKEMMKHSHYRRVNGAVRQVK